jgi:hypothetical protein
MEYVRDSNREHADKHMKQNLNKHYKLPLGYVASTTFAIDSIISGKERTNNMPQVYESYKHKAAELLQDYPNITFD